MDSFAPPCSPHPRRIFLVENDMDFRDCLALYLKLKGHTVFCATSMEEALFHLPESSCDVLLCDIRLPDGDGWQLLERLCLPHPIYAIAMSGVGAHGDRERSEAVGYRHHLLKPFPPSDITSLLEQTPFEHAVEI